MNTLLTGSLTLSLLHALIPSHWLPFVTIGKTERWSQKQLLTVTAVAGLAHTISTTLLGILVSLAGLQLAQNYRPAARHDLSERVIPLLLLALGLWYLIRTVARQHLRHHHVHDHIDAGATRKARSFAALLLPLCLAMFLSPCLEIDRVPGASLFPECRRKRLAGCSVSYPDLQHNHPIGDAADGESGTAGPEPGEPPLV